MITIIGSINLDLIAKVGRLPGPGETVLGNEFSTAPGGKGANQALAAARAGGAVRLIGATGSDAFAGQALELLKTGGIDLSQVRCTAEPTGIALILVGGDGENMIAVASGANTTLTVADIAGAGLARGEHVLLQLEIPLAAVEATLVTAREAGATTLLNTAPFRAEAAGLLAEADYVIANETEFDLSVGELKLRGETREQRMMDFAETTGRAIVVTLGSAGALAATPSGITRVEALNITPVDTVGAGDTFCGYLTAGLAAGLSLGEALRRASVAGSLACLKPGAQPSIPLKAEVDAALAAIKV